MPRYTLVGVRVETAQEAAQREWFASQVTAAPANLNEAARQIITLVTTLLGLLLGLLALASGETPLFLRTVEIKAVSLLALALWLVALAAGLFTVVPQLETAASGRPGNQAEVFERILRRKSIALTVAAIAFGLGLLALGVVLALAIWLA